MPRDTHRSLQSNIKNSSRDLTRYSLFLGGLNVKAKALEQYNPLKTGYTRIFVVQMPKFMNKILPIATKNFKHMIEYGFKSIDGIQNLTMEYEAITGGYAGRSFEIPTILKDETNAITIKLQEMSGSPVREYIEMWLSGISDPHTGLCHYHGAWQHCGAGICGGFEGKVCICERGIRRRGGCRKNPVYHDKKFLWF